MEHTKGPWKFVEIGIYQSDKDGCGYIRPLDEDGLEITHHGDMGRPREENVANAHLIASAPELLDFIKGQRSKMNCVCKLNKIAALLGTGIECTTCVMDNLISKAEGR